MQQDIDRILIDRQAISRRVREIAQQITQDLLAKTGSASTGSSLPQITLVPILTGSIIFVADLIRELPLYMQIRVMSASSYPDTATASQGVTMRDGLCDLPQSLAGAHVLVIDDILDSGRTLARVKETLLKRGPASVTTCVLLRKQRPEAMNFPVDYVCFDIPDRFVVGYGLDYNNLYRNLPDVVTLRPHVLGV